MRQTISYYVILEVLEEAEPRLARMEFQTEVGQTFLKLGPETLSYM